MSPAAKDHGRPLADLCADLRDHSTLTRTCAHCAYTITGTFADTNTPMRQHLHDAHGITEKPRRRRKEARAWTMVDGTDLDQNIANARAAGSPHHGDTP